MVLSLFIGIYKHYKVKVYIHSLSIHSSCHNSSWNLNDLSTYSSKIYRLDVECRGLCGLKGKGSGLSSPSVARMLLRSHSKPFKSRSSLRSTLRFACWIHWTKRFKLTPVTMHIVDLESHVIKSHDKLHVSCNLETNYRPLETRTLRGKCNLINGQLLCSANLNPKQPSLILHTIPQKSSVHVYWPISIHVHLSTLYTEPCQADTCRTCGTKRTVR